LIDASIALEWRGIPHALRDYVARYLRRHGWLHERIRRAVGNRRSAR